MYELLTNTAVRVGVGPLVDPTDGKTIEGVFLNDFDIPDNITLVKQ